MLFYKNLEEFIEGQKKKLEKITSANIPEKGLILKVLAQNKDQTNKLSNYSVTSEVDSLDINYLGILNDRHSRPSRQRIREGSIYAKGNVIREHRHIFVDSL